MQQSARVLSLLDFIVLIRADGVAKLRPIFRPDVVCSQIWGCGDEWLLIVGFYL